MNRFTVFLPAPSSKDLKLDVRRTWVVEEHVLDVPDQQGTNGVLDNDMEIDRKSQENKEKEKDHQQFVLLESSREQTPVAGDKEPIDSDGAFLFGQVLSKIYDGAVLSEHDLDEQYAFSQIDKLSKDSGECIIILILLWSHLLLKDAYEWSTSIGGAAVSTQASEVSLGGRQDVPPTSSYPQQTELGDTSMEEESLGNITRDSSDASIVRLPTFGIPMNRLASLRQMMQPRPLREMSGSAKVSVLAGILDIDGPAHVQIKKGVDAGLEVALLKILMGDEDGGICRLTAWRELAEEWAWVLSRGDVVLFRGEYSALFSKHFYV